ncbi:MAG TPA: MmgE/PrpD family protein, partial [Candidatus Limnocylindrales bacterium]|nr:MmgE/PrpD family protein [Candidatus Limnocylindrales bacterium]
MGPTETLARFVVDTQLRDLPTKAVEISKLVILDVLGVTLAASQQTIAQILTEYLREAAAAPRAGVIGSPLRTEPALAAWANGALA